MTEPCTVTLPQVMQVLDLAMAPEVEFQVALAQSVHRVANEQGIVLDAERVALAAQVVLARQSTTGSGPGKRAAVNLGWVQRPATEHERQRRLHACSSGWRGWLRRMRCDDQGKNRPGFIANVLMLGTSWFALCLLLAHVHSALFDGSLILGMMAMAALFMGETLEERYKCLLPADLNDRLKQHLQTDPDAQALLHRIQASATPTLLVGDLDVLVRHWVRQVRSWRP